MFRDTGRPWRRRFKNVRKKRLQYFILDKKGNPIGVPIKASSIYGKPILKEIEKKFVSNRQKRTKHKDNLKQRLDLVLERIRFNSISTLKSDLLKYGINAVLRLSDTGRVFGITYVDVRNKTVFNGSDSARHITQMR